MALCLSRPRLIDVAVLLVAHLTFLLLLVWPPSWPHGRLLHAAHCSPYRCARSWQTASQLCDVDQLTETSFAIRRDSPGVHALYSRR